MKKSKTDTIKKTYYKPKYEHIANKHYSDIEIELLADEMIKWFEDENNYWLKSFAINKRIGRQRISEFSKRNPYFEYIYSLCKDMQESKLVKLGLDKKNNSSLPIFALKNCCNWTDKQLNTFEKDSIEGIEIHIIEPAKMEHENSRRIELTNEATTEAL